MGLQGKQRRGSTLIIARHGNTFDEKDVPTRVGCRTDLPLVVRGKNQAKAIARFLSTHELVPNIAFSSPLSRTRHTCELILDGKRDVPMLLKEEFSEVDYGPDENKTEAEVLDRVGQKALDLWDSKGIPPNGWRIDPEQIKAQWQIFGDEILRLYPEMIVLVVTSNGIARFSPILAGDLEEWVNKGHSLKMGTGSISIFRQVGRAEAEKKWQVEMWNQNPLKLGYR